MGVGSLAPCPVCRSSSYTYVEGTAICENGHENQDYFEVVDDFEAGDPASQSRFRRTHKSRSHSPTSINSSLDEISSIASSDEDTVVERGAIMKDRIQIFVLECMQYILVDTWCEQNRSLISESTQFATFKINLTKLWYLYISLLEERLHILSVVDDNLNEMDERKRSTTPLSTRRKNYTPKKLKLSMTSLLGLFYFALIIHNVPILSYLLKEKILFHEMSYFMLLSDIPEYYRRMFLGRKMNVLTKFGIQPKRSKKSLSGTSSTKDSTAVENLAIPLSPSEISSSNLLGFDLLVPKRLPSIARLDSFIMNFKLALEEDFKLHTEIHLNPGYQLYEYYVSKLHLPDEVVAIGKYLHSVLIRGTESRIGIPINKYSKYKHPHYLNILACLFIGFKIIYRLTDNMTGYEGSSKSISLPNLDPNTPSFLCLVSDWMEESLLTNNTGFYEPSMESYPVLLSILESIAPSKAKHTSLDLVKDSLQKLEEKFLHKAKRKRRKKYLLPSFVTAPLPTRSDVLPESLAPWLAVPYFSYNAKDKKGMYHCQYWLSLLAFSTLADGYSPVIFQSIIHRLENIFFK